MIVGPESGPRATIVVMPPRTAIAAVLLTSTLSGCLADGTAHPLVSHTIRTILRCAAPIAVDAISSGGAPSRAAQISGGTCLINRLAAGPELGRVRPDAELAELGHAASVARVRVLDAREGRGSEADAIAAVAECERLVGAKPGKK